MFVRALIAPMVVSWRAILLSMKVADRIFMAGLALMASPLLAFAFGGLWAALVLIAIGMLCAATGLVLLVRGS